MEDIKNINVSDIHESLKSAGYCSNEDIDYAILAEEVTHKPLLLEGFPGVGKTSLAQAFAKAKGLPFIRVQMYDGLTDDKILYDYDYQRQLLTLESVKPILEREQQGKTLSEAIRDGAKNLDFYGRDFMIERPVLKSIDGKGQKILLFDEMDKAPEEIEYMLYEFLENYSISIPQYGTITCPEDQIPYVFITSNGYRNLSDAFKRRCLYLFIPKKTKDELVEILMTGATTDEKVAQAVAECIYRAGNANLHQQISVAEGAEWARFLSRYPERTKEAVMGSLSLIVKDQRDKETIKRIVADSGRELW